MSKRHVLIFDGHVGLTLASAHFTSAHWKSMEIVKVCILFFVRLCNTELLLTTKAVGGNITYDNLPVFSDYIPKWRPKLRDCHGNRLSAQA